MIVPLRLDVIIRRGWVIRRVDYSLGSPIAPPRCGRHECVGVASLERKGDGEHEVLLRVGASPHA